MENGRASSTDEHKTPIIGNKQSVINSCHTILKIKQDDINTDNKKEKKHRIKYPNELNKVIGKKINHNRSIQITPGDVIGSYNDILYAVNNTLWCIKDMYHINEFMGFDEAIIEINRDDYKTKGESYRLYI